jgi:hypothetical protein
MSAAIGCIFAEAERPGNIPAHNFSAKRAPQNRSEGQPAADAILPEAHVDSRTEKHASDPLDRNPDLWLYRKRTVKLLRRYLRYALETGRLPSILGSEFFRTRVTSYGVGSFEDRVIFVRDVEICLQRMDKFSQELIARIVLQEYSHEKTASLLHCTRMTVHRELPETLDRMSEIFLEVGLLEAVPPNREKTCQGGKSDDFPASAWEEKENKRDCAFDAVAAIG